VEASLLGCITQVAIVNSPGCPAAPIALHAGAIPHQSKVAALAAHLGSVVLRVGAAFGLAKRHGGGACDKRQFLTTMDPDVIGSIKQAALDLDRTASDIMEEAVKQWLRSKTKKG
jgi:hypothetical protein